jgi:TRAP-type C4-dicarboxylate transport system permease small subunit
MTAGLALAGTQAGKGHIVITIFQDRFPGRLRKILDMTTSFVCLMFFGMVAWQTWNLAMSIREFEEVSETLHIIYYPFILLVCLGLVALVVQLLMESVALCCDTNGEEAS